MGLLDNIYGWSDPNSYYPDATVNTHNVGGLLMGGPSSPVNVKQAGSSWMDDPSNMGLLGAAAALLKAGAPSTVPVSFGSAIGQGLMGGMQGYDSAKKLQTMQLAKEAIKPQLVEVDGVKKWVMPGQSEGVVVGNVKNKDPEWMSRDDNGNPIVNPLYLQMKQQTEKASTPYFQFLPTASGYAVGDARTGSITPPGDGGNMPIIRSQDNPELQGQIAGEKSYATAAGKDAAARVSALPGIIDQTQNTISLVDDLINHPGLSSDVGASRMLGLRYIPGSESKDFEVRLDQLKGQQFLQAYNTLKGGGQITEIEGKKATDAMSRMNPESSKDEFTKAAREFQGVLQRGLERAKEHAAGNPQASFTGDGGGQYSDADLQYTALKHGITVEEVKRRLGAQ